MKRYTGQKALYEAISRSRAKAKRGNVLEKLRVEPPKQEPPVAEEPKPLVEPLEIRAEEPQPLLVEESGPPPVEEPSPELAVDERPPELPAVEEKPQVPAEKVELPREAERREPVVVKPQPTERIGRPTPPSPVKPWLRPKPVQLNGGRIEVSVPYHIGVAAALVAVVIVLAAFRFGQKYPETQTPPVTKVNTPVRSTTQNAATMNAGKPQPQTPTPTPVATPRPAEQVPPQAAPQPQGDNWIVLAHHKQKADLDEVKKYFDQNGISLIVLPLADVRKAFAERGLDTALLPKGDGFLLVTNSLYGNPENPNTDGGKMKKKIAEVGANYKAPPGKEPFAPKYFSDAYGMKIR